MSTLSVEERRCLHEGCGVIPTLIDPESGYCWSHDPREEIAVRREEARQRAGETTARRLAKPIKGFLPGELGPLETVADLVRRLALLSDAHAEGRVTAADVTAQRAIHETWMKAKDLELREVDVKGMQRQIARMTANGKGSRR